MNASLVRPLGRTGGGAAGAGRDDGRGTRQAGAEPGRQPGQRAGAEQHQRQCRAAVGHAEHPEHPAGDPDRGQQGLLVDLYSFNYDHTGSRAPGSDAGGCMVAGPRWQGDKPEGTNKSFRSETDFSVILGCTQWFNPAAMVNVKRIQADYTVQPLSAFLKRPAPPAAAAIDFPEFVGDDPFKTELRAYLDVRLQSTPPRPIYLVMRLYWPKDTPTSILPAGEGTWSPPGLARVQ